MRLLGTFGFFILLISLQTTVFSSRFEAFPLYDLLVPAVVYLTLFRPYRSELLAVVPAGLLMDLLSEAPAGFFLVSYALILLIFQKTKKYFHVRNMGLFGVVCIIGILIEYAVFSVFSTLQTLSAHMPIYAFRTVLAQTAWAAVSVPFLYVILNHGFKDFDRFIARASRPNV